MSHIFRVGDRVRIKFSDSWPELAGQEGVVEGVDTWSFHHPTGRYLAGALVVAPAAWGTAWCPHKGWRFCPLASQLEPIQRRGDKLESYDTTATDEATKAMLKAMSGEGVAA